MKTKTKKLETPDQHSHQENTKRTPIHFTHPNFQTFSTQHHHSYTRHQTKIYSVPFQNSKMSTMHYCLSSKNKPQIEKRVYTPTIN